VVEQSIESLGIPPLALGALGGDKHEGELPALLDELRGAVALDLLQIVAPLTRAVQEQHQRPLPIPRAVTFRQIKQIVVLDRSATPT